MKATWNPSNFKVGSVLGIRNMLFKITRIEDNKVYFKLNIPNISSIESWDSFEEIRKGSWRDYKFQLTFKDYYEIL
jgi:hypothetical protein